jgi:DNA end-binding protein Ku
MYTLRAGAEVRSMAAIDELQGLPDKIKPDEIRLAKQVMETFETALDLSEYKDEYQEELRKMIDKKIAGEEIVAPPEEAPSKVVDLMEALRRSLDTVSATKKKPVKAELPRRAAAARPVARRRAR